MVVDIRITARAEAVSRAHKEAFAKLVSTLPPKHQVIIATEDNDTRKFLEKYCTTIKTYQMENWSPAGTEMKAA